MKKTKTFYWIFTGLLSLFMVMGSIPDIMSVPDAVTLFKHLGYPAYLLPFLGIAKILGVAALLIPGFPRVKEWAYAGLVFDMTGAMYSAIAVGDPASQWILFIVVYAVIAGSYIFYHTIRKSISMDMKSTVDLR